MCPRTAIQECPNATNTRRACITVVGQVPVAAVVLLMYIRVEYLVAAGAQFTCFTGTKVQNLTLNICSDERRKPHDARRVLGQGNQG
jgi:hypothetical protein